MEGVRTIYVDLDHTLLRVDLLRERLLLAIFRRPLLFLASIGWLLRGGRSRLKTEIARRSVLDIPNLPFNTELLAYLQEERDAGVRLVLATAAPHAWAQAISDHLDLFDRVLATGEATGNLTGRRKLAVIQEDSAGKPFGYAGGAHADRAIFEASQLPIVVGAARSLAGKQAERAVVIPPQRGVARAWLKSLRLPQWSKNLLLFVPAIAAHEPQRLWPNGVRAFFAFSFVASALYLLNDFCDLDLDRPHPDKKRRAQASGALRPSHALLLAGTFLMIAVTAAIPLPGAFDLILLTYGVVSALYSITLKHVPVLDLLTLTVLYTLRLYAGGAACGLSVSTWLVAFIFFLALSIVHLKRYAELTQRLPSGSGAPSISGGENLATLKKFGHTSGLIALLVLALYISSPQTLSHYKHPALLFLVCLFLFYWLERVWYRAARDRLSGDPIVFIVTDLISYLTVISALFVVWLAACY